LTRTGSLDALYEQYPSSDTEALAPAQAEKRFPLSWLQACFEEIPALDHPHSVSANLRDSPTDPGTASRGQATLASLGDTCGGQLTIYRLPQPGRQYVIGADPAEGNPQSDPSAAIVLDAHTGEEVAVFHGRAEPAVFAQHLAHLAHAYNSAALLVERNQHGHAVLLWLTEHGSRIAPNQPRPHLLAGTDGRLGWLTTSASKALLLTHLAEQLRHRRCTLHHRQTWEQLAHLDGATLRAPPGQEDDLAIAFALAVYAASEMTVPPCPIRTGNPTSFSPP
jgi:hypothetical protein